MNIILKKKKTLYFFSIITIVAICMMEPFFIVNDKTYSFIDTIKKIPPSEYSRFCIQDVFSFGSSSLWLYLIMPVIVATPLASYISDERKSMFHLYEKMRQGTPRYFGFRLFYSLMSSGIIVFIGLGIYLLVVCRYFDLYKVYPGGVMDIGGEGQGISELVRYFTVKFGYLVVYSFSISLLASFLVLLYND